IGQVPHLESRGVDCAVGTDLVSNIVAGAPQIQLELWRMIQHSEKTTYDHRRIERVRNTVNSSERSVRLLDPRLPKRELDPERLFASTHQARNQIASDFLRRKLRRVMTGNASTRKAVSLDPSNCLLQWS